MNIIDLGIISIILIFTFIGIKNGFVDEIFPFIAFASALAVAIRFYKPLSEGIPPILGNEIVSRVLLFTILFLVTYLILRRIANGIRALIDLATLGWLDTIAGGVVGFLKGSLLVGVALILWAHLILPIGGWLLEGSRIAPLFFELSRLLPPYIFEDLERRVKELYRMWGQ